MNKYRALILDDEPLARKVIREYLEKLDADLVIHEEGDPVAALKYLATNHIDILFLDINMPGLTGLDVASKIGSKVITIFTTAYAEHALEAFELAAFDYLVKPISLPRFIKTFDRIKEALESDDTHDSNFLFIKEGRRTYRLEYVDISRLQAYGDYVKIFTASKTYLVKARLSNYERSLGDNFIKVHRSHIVNLDHIDYVEGNFVRIGSENIPISESMMPKLQKYLNDFK